jgi:hypothetical protein
MLRIVLILAVVVAAAIAANVALLSVARGSDPVGQLSPVLASSPSARPVATPAVSRPDPQAADRPEAEAPAPARGDEDEDDADADD